MKSRRALSTVVGAVFAIIALTSTVTYVSYSMGILDNYNQSVLTKNQQLSDVNKEKFQISSVTIPNSKLNITVVNTGSVPINFTKIWIQNTTTTDWIRSYAPTHNFVTPGGVLTNIGQNIGGNINPIKSYNVKLVTSRGNSQQFIMNSAGVQPLNIQLLAFPTTVPSGFKSELVMVVINNSTSTLVNISPNNPTLTINNVANDDPTCTSNVVTPTKYATLSPGTTAIFTWDITVTGTGGDSCTASFTTPLQGGYPQTLTSPAIMPTAISLSSTTYAQNSGIITMDYSSFKWIETSVWNNDWQFPASGSISEAFQVTFQNNNATAGGYLLNMSKNSQILLTPTLGNTASSAHVPYAFFIVNTVNTNPNTNSYSLAGYSDYSAGIPNQGGVKTLYFGAISASGASQNCNGQNNNCIPAGQYYGLLILYGKYTKAGSFTGGTYAQTIPFFAIVGGS